VVGYYMMTCPDFATPMTFWRNPLSFSFRILSYFTWNSLRNLKEWQEQKWALFPRLPCLPHSENILVQMEVGCTYPFTLKTELCSFSVPDALWTCVHLLLWNLENSRLRSSPLNPLSSPLSCSFHDDSLSLHPSPAAGKGRSRALHHEASRPPNRSSRWISYFGVSLLWNQVSASLPSG
jgi:hypothetical protein